MYAVYLRKSRLDTDYENLEDTLKRHEETLTAFCKKNKLIIGKVFREVISGETLSARPQMQALLSEVTQRKYDGVICMDIDRLSRGSSFDSGYIMQVLQAYDCKIITPAKTYDLTKEMDEQFTDMQFMFSRYELKSITKRLSRGRTTSAHEGKFVGSVAPYGYQRIKIQGDKGYTLAIIENEARIVRKIFDLYIDGMGYTAIADYLNKIDMNKKWTKTSVFHVVTNSVYCGRVRWGNTPVKKEIINGKLVKKRSYNLMQCNDYDGLHQAIISSETFDRARAIRESRTHASVNVNRKIVNPFANLIYCSKCGGSIHMNCGSSKQNTKSWYFCKNKYCDCRTTKYDVIENAVLAEMRKWLTDYKIEIKNYDVTPAVDIDDLNKQISDLKKQQNKLCELLETGVYDVDLFTERNNDIKQRIKNLQEHVKNEQRRAQGGVDDVTPYCDELLSFYDVLDVSTKNKLWRKVLNKIEYYRQKGTDDIYIKIYPRV